MAKFDVYQEVTNQIVNALEAGTPPWRKPWTGDAAGFAMPKRANGEMYKGINVLMLWMMAEQRGFTSETWFTYRQAVEAGGQVRKGEKSTTVIYFNTVKTEDKQGEEKTIPFAKAYRVFNADQIEGLPAEFYQKPTEPRDLGTKADPELDGFFASIGAQIETSDKPQAYFAPSKDSIHMPPIETFHSANGYYATLAHESIHFTGVEKRLARYGKYSNKQEYAFEELVAEIGSCMLCAQLGLTPEFDQSAAYIEGWLKALKDDKRLIFKAASAAQKATDYLLEASEADEIEDAAQALCRVLTQPLVIFPILANIGNIAKEARMKYFSSTELANNTGDVLAAAAQSAVEINKHGKPRFVLLTVERFQDLLNHGAREAVHVSDLSDSEAATLIGDLQDSIEND